MAKRKSRKLPTDEELLAHPPFDDSGLKTFKKESCLKNKNRNHVRFSNLEPEQRIVAERWFQKLLVKHADRLATPQRQWLMGALTAASSRIATHGNNFRFLKRAKRFKQRRYLALKAREEGLDVPLPEWKAKRKKVADTPIANVNRTTAPIEKERSFQLPLD